MLEVVPCLSSAVRSGIIPPKFFQDRRATAYTNWGQSFWREALQNSIDAGATRIDISIVEAPAKTWPMGDPGTSSVIRVEIADNGCGMSLDTIENVFFRVGETTKRGATDAIGGFGTARMLLCFSHPRYEIHTGDIVVIGRSLEYLVRTRSERGLPPVRGCVFVIDIDLAEKSSSRLEADLRTVVALSDPRGCDVFVNGSVLAGRMRAGPRRRVLSALTSQGLAPFATVHYAATEDKRGVLIRQAGVWMISAWTPHKRTVIVELSSGCARDAMTETREALKGPYTDALNDLLGQLETESETALKTLEDEHVVDFSGKRGDLVIAGVQAACDNDIPLPEGVTGGFVVPATSAAAAETQAPASALPAPNTHASHSLVIVSRRLKHQSGLQKARRRFFPKNWKGERPAPAQILTAWVVACRHAIDALRRVHSRTGSAALTIRPGFLFEPADTVWGDNQVERMRTAGECRRNTDGSIALLINPVDDNGTLQYNLRRRKGEKSLQTLVAVAAHEVCHIAASKHNELFARLLTDVMAILDVDAVTSAIRVALREMSAPATAGRRERRKGGRCGE